MTQDADLAAIRELRALCSYMERRDEIIRAARDAGVPQWQIIKESGFSKGTVSKILKERDMSEVATPDGETTITREDGSRLVYGPSSSDINKGDRVILDADGRPGTVYAIGVDAALSACVFTVTMDDGDRVDDLLPGELHSAGYDWARWQPDGELHSNGWCETAAEMEKVAAEFRS